MPCVRIEDGSVFGAWDSAFSFARSAAVVFEEFERRPRGERGCVHLDGDGVYAVDALGDDEVVGDEDHGHAGATAREKRIYAVGEAVALTFVWDAVVIGIETGACCDILRVRYAVAVAIGRWVTGRCLYGCLLCATESGDER